jgi:hypothetical protein
MARGNSPQTQVFYKGSSGDQFCIFVESAEAVQKWKADSTIPMVDVVAGWKVLVPEHGKQGVLNTASKQQLENEFGAGAKEDDIFKKILQEGDIQSSEVSFIIHTCLPSFRFTLQPSPPLTLARNIKDLFADSLSHTELRAHWHHQRVPGRTSSPLNVVPSSTQRRADDLSLSYDFRYDIMT